MPHVEVILPDREPLTFPLTTDEATIGRSEGCDLKIPSQFVSSKHTSIALRAVIRDLGSTNGTWVEDEQVAEKALGEGATFHFGFEDKVHIRVVLADQDGTAQLPPITGSVVEELEADLVRMKERMERVEADRETLQKELLKFTGSEILLQPVAEPKLEEAEDSGGPTAADRIRELEEAVSELESQNVELKGVNQQLNREVETLRAKPPAAAAAASPSAPVAPGSADAEIGEMVSRFAECSGLDLDPTLLETMRRRPGVLKDAGFALGKLLHFSRDVEKVISALALSFRGSSAAAEGGVTMLPGWQGNIRRSVTGLLMQGGDSLQDEFEHHLARLSGWYLACISAYKTGAARWYERLLDRTGPGAIESSVKTSPVLNLIYWNYRQYWEAYRERMEDLTHDIAMDEIDQFAAEDAVKLADANMAKARQRENENHEKGTQD